ncbi:HTH-type transcriptional regulator TsaQ1/TsaQ2 [Burkholderiales bacterium]|nr:HTH-type transcriptional regulator TsaQ1/TsaQ2 [Burkholderiales bacterium]
MRKATPKAPHENANAAKSSKDRQFVTALARGLEILRAFTPRHPVLGNNEIAQRAKLPKPTVTRLTYTLTQLGYLNYSAESGKYSLSVGVLALGYSFLASQDIRSIARPMMQEFAEYARAAVCLAARDQPHMVFLEVCQGNPTFQMRLEIGARVPYGSTALGRAYHCGLSPEGRITMIEEHRKLGPKGDWEAFRASFDKAVRDYEKYGFCVSLGEWNKDVYSVAVPLIARDHSKVLALTCAGPPFDLTRQRIIEDIGPRLVRLRDRIFAATHGNF